MMELFIKLFIQHVLPPLLDAATRYGNTYIIILNYLCGLVGSYVMQIFAFGAKRRIALFETNSIGSCGRFFASGALHISICIVPFSIYAAHDS